MALIKQSASFVSNPTGDQALFPPIENNFVQIGQEWMSCNKMPAIQTWRVPVWWCLSALAFIIAGMIVVHLSLNQLTDLHRQRINSCNISTTAISKDGSWLLVIVGLIPLTFFLSAMACLNAARIRIDKRTWFAPLVVVALVFNGMIAICGGLGNAYIAIDEHQGFICHHGP